MGGEGGSAQAQGAFPRGGLWVRYPRTPSKSDIPPDCKGVGFCLGSTFSEPPQGLRTCSQLAGTHRGPEQPSHCDRHLQRTRERRGAPRSRGGGACGAGAGRGGATCAGAGPELEPRRAGRSRSLPCFCGCCASEGPRWVPQPLWCGVNS